MKAKTIIVAFTLFLITILFPQKTLAQEQAAGSSATFSSILETRGQDDRVAILRDYLAKQDSPLTPYADVFVSQADLYHLDWRFVAAIAGRESSFGKSEPCINAWGWGIYGTQTKCFDSYDEAIRTISKGLKEQYIDQWGAASIWDIGRMYAASPTWASGVIYFMNDMQTFATAEEATKPLPISL